MSKNDTPCLIPPRHHSPQDRRVQRLTHIANDLASGATTVEELGSRLRDDIKATPARNLARPPEAPADHGETVHSHVDATGVHGGIIPGP